MLKHLYKTIILLAVFVGSLFYFSDDVKVETRQERLETVEMGEVTYPTITILLEDNIEVNRLHGYSNNVDSRMSRDAITPLNEEQSFKVCISENEYEIKRVDYELLSIYDDNIIETDNIKALEQDELKEHKLAKIKFKTPLENGQEYYMHITLVTNKSKKINYYTRVKKIDESYYKEKLDYVKDFNRATFNKDESISTYLKNVNNPPEDLPFDQVTWGDLKPKIVGDIIPTIKEISGDLASVELKYIISADTNSGTSYYYINEFYRIRYTTNRIYLLDFHRSMESVFGTNDQETMNGDIKLGTSKNKDIEVFHNSDTTRFAFVFNRELWCFNQFDNSLVKVFSFRQKESDYIRDIYDEHNVKIINMDDDGNIDFLVYGYMNRGAYEGYVGIVLYRFYSMDNRIEELTYIPINIPYHFLKEMIEDFSYVNEMDIFYFHINDTIYSYNLITKKLIEVVSDVQDEDFIFSREENYIAWEETNEEGLSKKVIIYDLESQDKIEINTKEDAVINLLGTIDNDFIYGIANINDIITTIDGKKETPMYEIIISDPQGKILKEYREEESYITDIEVEGNIITLKRSIKTSLGNNEYLTPIEDNSILTNIDLSSKGVRVIQKDSDSPLDLEELYITSSNLSNDDTYKYEKTVNTVVKQDTTIRIDKEIAYPGDYIVYALGDIQGIYKQAKDAINKADENVGLVFDLNQHKVWGRGFTKTAREIKDGSLNQKINADDSFKAATIALVQYKYNNVNIRKNISGYELLEEHFGESYINLSGASLSQVLYFVSEGRPVIVKANPSSYELIIGYDSNSITTFNPMTGNTNKSNRDQAEKHFSDLGSIYISYTEEY